MSKSTIEKRQEKISSFEEQIEQLKKRKQKEAQLMRKDEQRIRTQWVLYKRKLKPRNMRGLPGLYSNLMLLTH
ncbi:MAG: hypothetical protein FWB74_00140 [Defluviitaleaceae bacterium]|nr:hypothetical protein [Defluviitaleaceae bacterium]